MAEGRGEIERAVDRQKKHGDHHRYSIEVTEKNRAETQGEGKDKAGPGFLSAPSGPGEDLRGQPVKGQCLQGPWRPEHGADG